MSTVSTPDRLPNPHNPQSPAEHRFMSQRFLVHAERELKAKRRLQASEKIWGAVTHQFAAIAEQRGWEHEHHRQLKDMAYYLDKEQGSEDLRRDLGYFETFHNNFYRNQAHSGDIRLGLRDAKALVEKLEEVRQAEPKPFKIESDFDRRVVSYLTGRPAPPINTTSDQGFTTEEDRRLRRAEWGKGKPDTDTPPSDDGRTPLPINPAPPSGAPSATVPVPAPPDTTSAIRPESKTIAVTAPKINPMTDVDTGAGVLLDSPKPPTGVHMGTLRGAPPTSRPQAIVPKQPKKGRRAGSPSLPSGRKDRRR